MSVKASRLWVWRKVPKRDMLALNTQFEEICAIVCIVVSLLHLLYFWIVCSKLSWCQISSELFYFAVSHWRTRRWVLWRSSEMRWWGMWHCDSSTALIGVFAAHWRSSFCSAGHGKLGEGGREDMGRWGVRQLPGWALCSCCSHFQRHWPRDGMANKSASNIQAFCIISW